MTSEQRENPNSLNTYNATEELINDVKLFLSWWRDDEEVMAAIRSIPYVPDREQFSQLEILSLLAEVTPYHLSDITSISTYASALLADSQISNLLYRQRYEKWEKHNNPTDDSLFGKWEDDIQTFHKSYFLAKTSQPFVFSAVAYRTPQEATRASVEIYGGKGFIELPLTRNGWFAHETYVYAINDATVVSLERGDKHKSRRVIHTHKLIRCCEITLLHYTHDEVSVIEKQKRTISAQ